jgi:hypothetical protein
VDRCGEGIPVSLTSNAAAKFSRVNTLVDVETGRRGRLRPDLARVLSIYSAERNVTAADWPMSNEGPRRRDRATRSTIRSICSVSFISNDRRQFELRAQIRIVAHHGEGAGHGPREAPGLAGDVYAQKIG